MKTTRPRILLWTLLSVALFGLAGCATTPKEFTLTAPPVKPGAKDFPKDDAVYLLRREHIVLSQDGSIFQKHVHIQLKVLNEQGVRYAKMATALYSHHQEVSNLYARIIRPGGWITKTEKQRQFGETRPRTRLAFDDAQAKATRFGNILPGSVLELRYTVKGKTWEIAGFRFQLAQSTVQAEYSISAPSDLKLNNKAVDGPGFAASNIKYSQTSDPDRSGYMLHTWKANNIPRLKRESGMPSATTHAARVYVSPQQFTLGKQKGSYGSWNEFATFYNSHIAKGVEPTPAVTSFTKELTAKASSKDDKVQRIFDFVCRDILLTPQGIGLGGWQTQSADETLKQRFGDSKAKAILMIAMLKTIGVKALPVFVRKRSMGKAPFPTRIFSHVINFLPSYKGGMYVDVNVSKNKLENLGWDNQGAFGLIIDGNQGKPVTLPMHAATKNLSHRRLALHNHKGKAISGALTLKLGGAFRTKFDKAAKKFSKAKARKGWAKRQFSFLGRRFFAPKSLKVKKVAVSGQKGDHVTVKISFSARFHRALRKGGTYVINMKSFTHGNPSSRVLGKRKQNPIIRKKKSKHIDELILTGWQALDTPNSLSADTKHAKYKLSYSSNNKNNTIRYKRSLTLPTETIPFADHKAFRAQFAKVRAHEYRLLLMRNPPPPPPPKPRPDPAADDKDGKKDDKTKKGSKAKKGTKAKAPAKRAKPKARKAAPKKR